MAAHSSKEINPAAEPARGPRPFLLLAAALALVLAALFHQSFKPEMVLFANDAPLGTLKAGSYALPRAFTGVWLDLNWIGIVSPSTSPTFSALIASITSPEGYLKLFSPLALFVLGLSASVFFRQLRFAPMVCVLGGLAAALNSNTFSNACWGQPSRAMAQAAVFLALAALQSGTFGKPWIKAALAGLAVGLGIMEGFDIGAIYSLYVAAFAVFLVLIHEEGSIGKKIGRGAMRVGMVAVFAAFIAAHALISLVGTQLQGVTGGEQQTPEAKAHRWDFATQWSLPKLETLRVVIPGLFGYRMQGPEEEMYWGSVGQTPSWAETRQGIPRFSGSGEYAGILVVLIAIWGLAQSFRRSGGPFSLFERKFIWFWGGLAFVSLLFSWGRHAPFYHIVYALPYFSTIRNPMKFMHPFHLALVILFACGLQGLWRLYLEKAKAVATGSVKARLRAWWSKATLFDKRWTAGVIIAVLVSALALLILASSRSGLESHLAEAGFSESQARQIAGFSLRETGWFVVLLALSASLLTLLKAGIFAGRAKWAWAILGVFLVADLARANLPWIVYQDYREKYEANPVVEILRESPHTSRVAMELIPATRSYLAQTQQLWPALANEWLQHHFQFHNIQSLDIIQFPRMPELDESYLRAFRPTSQQNLFGAGRLWQLTNTRYIIAETGFLDLLNQQVDPMHQGFRIHSTFDIVPKPGVVAPSQVEHLTVTLSPGQAGQLALIEYETALPRVGLYAQWEISTEKEGALARLAHPTFDPRELVLVAGGISGSGENVEPAQGEIEFLHYESKRVQLRASTDRPAVLLLNDRYDPDWNVWVNGEPATLLRCNYIMRGAHLPAAGEYEIEFRFQPPVKGLYVSIAAILVGIGLGGLLLARRRR